MRVQLPSELPLDLLFRVPIKPDAIEDISFCKIISTKSNVCHCILLIKKKKKEKDYVNRTRHRIMLHIWGQDNCIVRELMHSYIITFRNGFCFNEVISRSSN